MQMPEMAPFVRVDELIECFNIGKETQRALLKAMPDAYGGVEEVDLEDAWPEPDAARDAPYKLDRCWAKLDESAQSDVARAMEEHYGPPDEDGI